MKRVILVALMIALIAVVSVSIFLSPLTNREPTEREVVFILNWLPSGAHVPLYVALNNGYYKEERLNVKIIPSRGSLDAISSVEAGKATLGYADFPAVITSIARGANVKAVGVVMHRTNGMIATASDTGIVSLKDLENRVGVGSPFLTPQVWPLFSRMNGIDPAKVRIEFLGTGLWTAVAQRTADFAVDTIEDIPLYEPAFREKRRDAKPVFFKFADYGFDAYGAVIITSNQLIQSDPDLTARFLKASARGYSWTYKNQAEALTIFLKLNPEGKREIDGPKLQFLLNDMIGQERLDKLTGRDLFKFEQDRTEFTIQLVMSYAGVKPVASRLTYTNDFLR